MPICAPAPYFGRICPPCPLPQCHTGVVQPTAPRSAGVWVWRLPGASRNRRYVRARTAARALQAALSTHELSRGPSFWPAMLPRPYCEPAAGECGVACRSGCPLVRLPACHCCAGAHAVVGGAQGHPYAGSSRAGGVGSRTQSLCCTLCLASGCGIKGRRPVDVCCPLLVRRFAAQRRSSRPRHTR